LKGVPVGVTQLFLEAPVGQSAGMPALPPPPPTALPVLHTGCDPVAQVVTHVEPVTPAAPGGTEQHSSAEQSLCCWHWMKTPPPDPHMASVAQVP